MYTCDLVLFISSFLPLAIIIVFWVYNAMKLIGCTLVNCCCYCWVLSAAEHAYECCLFHCFPAWPTPHRIFLLRSLCTFSSMSWVTGLRRRGGGREDERVNERKGIPLPFSPDPLPLYTQATTSRMPGLGHTFWFYSFVPWVQREYRARLEISYIDFFSKELKLGPFQTSCHCRAELNWLN